MKYVVTAVNRLPGEREAVTSPKDKETAVRLCAQLKLMKASKRVWLRPRIMPCPWQEEWLLFTPPIAENERILQTRRSVVTLRQVTK